MCLILIAWKTHPDYRLVVAANRDELYSRPSAAAHFWPASPQVLAGRDQVAGGTWLGVGRHGRFSALTNYREGGQPMPNAASRGALVADFLTGQANPEHYLAALVPHAADFNGFNLLVGDDERLAYYANRSVAPRCLSPGIYGLSNHLLDTPWPKLASAKSAFREALTTLPAHNLFFELLADREIVADERLPNTGVALAWERLLSAIFVSSPHYGTRASTLLTLRNDGQTTLIERSFGSDAQVIGEVREQFYGERSFQLQSSLISTGR
jgi:uncharacterized protein with NRDE domain